MLHGNRFALANLTTSSTFGKRELHSIISEVPYITTAKHFDSCTYILVVHFTASSIRGLQKLEFVGMVSYHYIFQILKCF